MLYAWIDGVKRSPVTKGEKTQCRDCGGTLSSVMPVENIKHWRHKAGDCDRWSEPEGPWHLNWKEAFPEECREIGLRDVSNGELHRADLLVPGSPRGTVLELQHSSISEQERLEREAFYTQNHRMFWLVHLHDEQSSTGTSFSLSLGVGSRSGVVDGHTFNIAHFASRSSQFIEKWKRSKAHVFFDYRGYIFYLANGTVSMKANGGLPLDKGDFATCELSPEQFIHAVYG